MPYGWCMSVNIIYFSFIRFSIFLVHTSYCLYLWPNLTLRFISYCIWVHHTSHQFKMRSSMFPAICVFFFEPNRTICFSFIHSSISSVSLVLSYGPTSHICVLHSIFAVEICFLIVECISIDAQTDCKNNTHTVAVPPLCCHFHRCSVMPPWT